MNLAELPLIELRGVYNALSSMCFDNPEFKASKKLKAQLIKYMRDNPDYRKGQAFLAQAKKFEGFENGNTRPEDLYFAVLTQQIEEAYTGKKLYMAVQLLVCSKWEWWMNGQSFNPNKNYMPRNFDDFLTDEMTERYEEKQEYTKTEDELRIHLKAQGLEELPAMVPIYLEHCDDKKRRLDADDE